MYDKHITIDEIKEVETIALSVHLENDNLFELGQRINKRFPHAYMNGYNWTALIMHYVKGIDPSLAEEVEIDPEASLFSIYLRKCNSDNHEKMKRFRQHIIKMLDDENCLMDFIEKNYDDIEWD